MTEKLRDKIIQLDTDMVMSYADAYSNVSYSDGVILSDYNFWGSRQDDIDDWCARHKCIRSGVLLFFEDPESFVMFKLEWL